MTEPRCYNNPPIEEAVCEFRFKPGNEWDLTIPGKLQAKINGDYTGKPQQQRAFQVALHETEGRPQELQYGDGLEKILLVTENGKRKVGVGNNVLSIHMLRPYQDPTGASQGGWEEFLQRIKEALDAYWHVATPEGVSSIGVRYTNKISISFSKSQPSAKIKIKDYLHCAPPDVEGLPEEKGGYISRVEYIYDQNNILILSHGTVSAPPEQVCFLLDIDVISKIANPIEQDEALKITKSLREREREVFELLITDKARGLFE